MDKRPPGKSRLYPFLIFEPGVDWQHVNPQLLQGLNRMGAQKGVVITVISGYRTPAHSVAVGGFADDPHTKGIAVDAEVGGKPVGSVFSAKQFQAAGLETGNQPGFFNGKPDPGHVQLPSSAETPTPNASSAATTATTDTSAPTPSPASNPSDSQLAAADTANAVLPPPATATPGQSAVPQVAAPGPVAGSVADLWRQVAALPQVSPETQQLAANALIAQGAG
jgi:hypothetical protein